MKVLSAIMFRPGAKSKWIAKKTWRAPRIPSMSGASEKKRRDAKHRQEPTPGAARPKKTPRAKLPALLRPLFWDYDFDALRWEQDRDLLIARVLTAGGWKAIRWLRDRCGDADLREWIIRHRGAGLTPRQLRFWELILGLPAAQVNAWVARAKRSIWNAGRWGPQRLGNRRRLGPAERCVCQTVP